jgi:hypothetical protein
MAGKAKPGRLWKEVALTLALKVLVLTIIWAAWFSSPEDITLNDQKVASQILSQQPQKELDHDAVPGTR